MGACRTAAVAARSNEAVSNGSSMFIQSTQLCVMHLANNSHLLSIHCNSGSQYTFLACRPPDAISQHVGLTSRKCSADAELLDETARERYRQQVPGWRISSSKDGVQCIRHEWTARDADAAQQLVAQVQQIAQQEGHPLSHTDVVGSTVVAELMTAAKGESY